MWGTLGTRVSYKAYYVRTCIPTQDVARELTTRGAGEGGLWLTTLLRPRRLRNLQLLSLGAGSLSLKLLTTSTGSGLG